MVATFRTYTPTGIEQINSQYGTLRLNAYGTAGAAEFGGQISVPDLTPEMPILLVRPPPDVSVGGFVTWQRYASTGGVLNAIGYQSNGPFDWAVASVSGAPVVVGSGRTGIKTWSESGNLTFSSQYRFPRIISIEDVPSPDFGAAPMSRAKSIGGWASRPWIIVSDLIYVYDSAGGLGSNYGYPPAVFAARVNAANSVLTVEMRSSENFSATGFALSPSLNPFASRPLRLPLCVIPGL